MKKIFTFILIVLSCAGIFGSTTYAQDNSVISIEVTENVLRDDCIKQDTGLYKCNIGTGFSSVMNIIGEMIKYATFIAGLAGVLFIVINGILYSMSGMDAGMKDEAKKRITKTLLGLVLLFLSGFILNAIAPWIYV